MVLSVRHRAREVVHVQTLARASSWRNRGGSRLRSPSLDLQYRLVRAASNEDAYERALELGRKETHSYANADGQTVTWECLGLHDLSEIDDSELVDGTEVYSQIVNKDSGVYVVAKEQLSCFWSSANKKRTAAEILNDEPTV
jgi:Domain of unknown function (DUF4288)